MVWWFGVFFLGRIQEDQSQRIYFEKRPLANGIHCSFQCNFQELLNEEILISVRRVTGLHFGVSTRGRKQICSRVLSSSHYNINGKIKLLKKNLRLKTKWPKRFHNLQVRLQGAKCICKCSEEYHWQLTPKNETLYLIGLLYVSVVLLFMSIYLRLCLSLLRLSTLLLFLLWLLPNF